MPTRRLAALVVLLAALIGAPAPVAAAPLASRWPEAEAFEKQLIDCTRSGGWVKVDGTCDEEDKDARVPRRKPLKLSLSMSDELARPYARRLARAGYLSHFLGGTIAERFRRVGLVDGRYGENLGYTRDEDAMAAVLHIHRLFQEEWSYNGWHWKNLTDRRFTQVGVGVWVRDGRTYLVLDFHS